MSYFKPAPGVKKRRTNFYGQKFLDFHRTFGFNCPMCDVDALCVEYDNYQPVALIEAKHENYGKPSFREPSYRVLGRLAVLAGLPLFNVMYNSDCTQFLVTALGDKAKSLLSQEMMMDAPTYVKFHEHIRAQARKAGYEWTNLAANHDIATDLHHRVL